MRLFLRSLLLFCFLMLGRESYLSAYTLSGGSHLCIGSTHSAPGTEYFRLKAVEIEEENDDEVSSKKYSTSTEQFFAGHRPQQEYSYQRNVTTWRYAKYCSYTSRHKYLIYGVFRI